MSLDFPVIVEFVFMLVINLGFVLALIVLMLPLGIYRQAAYAVMKRNFVGYFSNPTGYVFLCIFVLLTSFAAFWPHEFFTTNLANFDQLNKFLPYIMLVFIPAITMSIWAEERRQGTDELLLTLPAKDFDIVIGKYFAAVLVFTVSLLFSQLSNYAVLLAMTGGQLDAFLLFSTYLGYWFVGIAMLSVGMVASFLTSNLTVGFIFGAAFNAPLAFFSNADVIFSNSTWVQRLFDWSLLQRFEPLGRGLVSLSSIFYFLGIVVIGIYLSLVLIGRRHWLGGRDGTSLLWHYVVRAACLAITVIGVVLIVQHSPLNKVRFDISDQKVSTLSDSTIGLLKELAEKTDEPEIEINAYISNNIPTEYVRTKYDLINLLREFDVLGGKRINVNLFQGIDPFSKDAIDAEKKFGIRPARITSEIRGAIREDDVVLGAAFQCGRERVVIRFFPYGTPVEYELMRSLNTVSQAERKTIGIVQSDAFLTGAVVTVQDKRERIPQLQIVSELEKQYNVEPVTAATEIPIWLDDDEANTKRRRYDVLLVAQPSSLSQVELDNLIKAIQTGQPTVVLEDPLPSPENFPWLDRRGTFLPRAVARGNTRDACRIDDLWAALDLDIDRAKRQNQAFPWIVWQMESENPYPRDRRLDDKERVIVREENPSAPTKIAGHPSTTGISELYFPFAGYLRPLPESELDINPLVQSGRAGRILWSDFFNAQSEDARNRNRGASQQEFIMAAHISGSEAGKDDLSSPEKPTPSKSRTNVIYICDIDMLSNYFVQIRNNPIVDGIDYRFQNMSFLLNVVDSMAGEQSYLTLRNRQFRHVTLRVVEKTTESAMDQVYEAKTLFEKQFITARNQILEKSKSEILPLEEEILRMEKNLQENTSTTADSATVLNDKRKKLNQIKLEQELKFRRQVEELENARREDERGIQLTAVEKIQEIQKNFKLYAVTIPVIPPLLVGLIVFTRRRLREREGISKARRLK